MTNIDGFSAVFPKAHYVVKQLSLYNHLDIACWYLLSPFGHWQDL